jgi:hypothetical protein
MTTFNVIAFVKVPTPGSQIWNGSSYQTGTRQQEIRTQITARNYFEARAMIEGQYGSNLIGQPIITESR